MQIGWGRDRRRDRETERQEGAGRRTWNVSHRAPWRRGLFRSQRARYRFPTYGIQAGRWRWRGQLEPAAAFPLAFLQPETNHRQNRLNFEIWRKREDAIPSVLFWKEKKLSDVVICDMFDMLAGPRDGIVNVDSSFHCSLCNLGGARRRGLCFVVRHGCTVFPATA